MGKVLNERQFNTCKQVLKKSYSIEDAASKVEFSVTTMRRVNKSKNYADYKKVLVGDRGPKYAERNKTQKWNPESGRTTKKKGGFLGIFKKKR